MSRDIFPQTTQDLAAARKKLAPHIHDAFTAFSESVFAEGALPTKTKQLIAIAAAHRVAPGRNRVNPLPLRRSRTYVRTGGVSMGRPA